MILSRISLIRVNRKAFPTARLPQQHSRVALIVLEVSCPPRALPVRNAQPARAIVFVPGAFRRFLSPVLFGADGAESALTFQTRLRCIQWLPGAFLALTSSGAGLRRSPSSRQHWDFWCRFCWRSILVRSSFTWCEANHRFRYLQRSRVNNLTWPWTWLRRHRDYMNAYLELDFSREDHHERNRKEASPLWGATISNNTKAKCTWLKVKPVRNAVVRRGLIFSCVWFIATW